MIERERQRAWRSYQMLVMAGLEFNKDGYTRKTSAHLLGIDLKTPIRPRSTYPRPSRKSTRRAAWPWPRTRTS